MDEAKMKKSLAIRRESNMLYRLIHYLSISGMA